MALDDLQLSCSQAPPSALLRRRAPPLPLAAAPPQGYIRRNGYIKLSVCPGGFLRDTRKKGDGRTSGLHSQDTTIEPPGSR